MEQAQRAKSNSMKEAYLCLERTSHNERECLLRVISTFGLLMDRSSKYRGAYREIKDLMQDGKDLPVDDIHLMVKTLRSRIFMEELKGPEESCEADPDVIDRNHLLEAYEVLNKIVTVLTDGFYPMIEISRPPVEPVHPDFRQGMASAEFHKATEQLFSFVDKLKNRISEDFKSNNDTFLNFFNQVRDLEKILTKDFSDTGSAQSYDTFEQKIQKDVGSIADSFSTYTTLNQVKNAVVGRLGHIRQVLAKRRKTEKERAKKSQEKMVWLRKKISQTETEVRKLSIKADRFQEEANRDDLSGLYNRKAFDARVAEALASYNKGGSAFLLVMFDVDDFKWINDTFGHVAGDKIIQEVAAVLSRTFRKNEFIARYGGDEFAAVIEGLTETTARKRIANFKKSFSKLRFSSQNGGDINISISAGIASVAKGDCPEDIIHKADTAMYKMKKKRKP